MTGRITRLIEDQRSGMIAGDDGSDYTFSGHSLLGMSFASIHLGMSVSFTPSGGLGIRRAMSVRVPPT